MRGTSACEQNRHGAFADDMRGCATEDQFSNDAVTIDPHNLKPEGAIGIPGL
jgi:hypothetical protein